MQTTREKSSIARAAAQGSIARAAVCSGHSGSPAASRKGWGRAGRAGRLP
jgi:hypothetical protein